MTHRIPFAVIKAHNPAAFVLARWPPRWIPTLPVSFWSLSPMTDEKTDSPQVPVANIWHAALIWVKSQSTETVLLVGIFAVVTYGSYLGFTKIIPDHIRSITDAHERVVKTVTEKDERQREADRQIMMRFLDRLNGGGGQFDARNVAKRPE